MRPLQGRLPSSQIRFRAYTHPKGSDNSSQYLFFTCATPTGSKSETPSFCATDMRPLQGRPLRRKSVLRIYDSSRVGPFFTIPVSHMCDPYRVEIRNTIFFATDMRPLQGRAPSSQIDSTHIRPIQGRTLSSQIGSTDIRPQRVVGYNSIVSATVSWVCFRLH